MILEDEIIKKYLIKADYKEYSDHWVFYNIEKDRYLFKEPSYKNEILIQDIYKRIISFLKDFKPFNEEYFNLLFPNFKSILENTPVILTVGCPFPYDAMFREFNGRDYVIFDLIRFSQYAEKGYDLNIIIKILLTHEFTHKCIKEKYPLIKNASYLQKLNYIVFDEGFAHLLSYKDNIKSINFSSENYKDKFQKAKLMLIEAVKEKKEEEQKEWLKKADSGEYWEKFPSICGKLYLADNLSSLSSIYIKGWKYIISDIIYYYQL